MACVGLRVGQPSPACVVQRGAGPRGGRGNGSVKLLADAECGVQLQGHPVRVLPPPWAGIESPGPLGSSGPAEPLTEGTVGVAVGAASVLGAAIGPCVQPSEWPPPLLQVGNLTGTVVKCVSGGLAIGEQKNQV